METNEFVKSYEVTWEQLDPLGHLRAPVLLDYILNTQMSWITAFGYGQTRLASAGYDPVIPRLEARYIHEAMLAETLLDRPQLSGLSHDGSMWKTYHEVVKRDGDKVATVKLEGTSTTAMVLAEASSTGHIPICENSSRPKKSAILTNRWSSHLGGRQGLRALARKEHRLLVVVGGATQLIVVCKSAWFGMHG